MIREIEIWFTSNRGREVRDAVNMRKAKTICAELFQSGFKGIVVDVTFYSTRNGERHDLIESKSKSYSFTNKSMMLI